MAKNILVVFYSRTGHTKRLANDIVSALGADTEEIREKKERKGILGWLSAGRDAMKKIKAEIEPLQKDPANYDLVIIGTPIWAGTITPAARTYLEMNKEKIRKYAFFAAAGSTLIEEISTAIKEIVSNDPAASAVWYDKELKDENIYDKKLANFVSSIKNSN